MQSLYSGLVGYWNLQDQSGSRLDLTGNGSTLTNTNTVTTVDGLVGQASGFVTASSQRLTAASSSVLQGGPKDFTIAAWVYLTDKTTVYCFMSKLSITAGQAEYQMFYNSATDRLQMSVYTATDVQKTVQGSTFGSPTAATWYFLCGWYDNTAQTVNVEVNATGADSASTAAAAQAASSGTFAIGSLGNIGSNYLNGRVCEASKWDRLLTPQERRWLYNNGRGRTYPFTGRYAIGLSRHGRSRRMQGIG